MKITIDKIRNRLVARGEAGNILAERKTYCNPAALSQIVLDAERIGKIDWENSQVSRPVGKPLGEPTKQIRAYAADVPELARPGTGKRFLQNFLPLSAQPATIYP